MISAATPRDIRHALLTRQEIALIDLRGENDFAQAHPLFASQMELDRIDLESPDRLPRKTVPIVLYDNGEDLGQRGAARLAALGYSNLAILQGGLSAWRDAGYELFQDVNSYCKAFGELVESRRHTPSLPAPQVQAMMDRGDDMVILDSRRFDEYNTMSIPGGVSTPGAELVLRAAAVAPDPATTVIVNCAGRTRSLIGAQSLVNAGLPNPVYALRNGTIGWSLAKQSLEHGQTRKAPLPGDDEVRRSAAQAREVAYRAGVRRIDGEGLARLSGDTQRTLYRFDVRQPDEYAAGHIAGFRNRPGGQLVQETDMAAPVRGARIVLADDRGVRADMTASWLAQMAWEVYVLDGGFEGPLATGEDRPAPRPDPATRYKRPYEGTDNPTAAMQAYLDWEFGLVDQLARDGTHGFFVI